VDTEATPTSPPPEEAKPETGSDDPEAAVEVRSMTGMYGPPPGP